MHLNAWLHVFHWGEKCIYSIFNKTLWSILESLFAVLSHFMWPFHFSAFVISFLLVCVIFQLLSFLLLFSSRCHSLLKMCPSGFCHLVSLSSGLLIFKLSFSYFVPGLHRLWGILCHSLANTTFSNPSCTANLAHSSCSDTGEAGCERGPTSCPGAQTGSHYCRAGENITGSELCWQGAESPGAPDTASSHHTEGSCVYLYKNCRNACKHTCCEWTFSFLMSYQNDLSLLRSSSSEETLAVEEVLGSFDFLSNDLNGDDDASCLGSLRLKDSG